MVQSGVVLGILIVSFGLALHDGGRNFQWGEWNEGPVWV